MGLFPTTIHCAYCIHCVNQFGTNSLHGKFVAWLNSLCVVKFAVFCCVGQICYIVTFFALTHPCWVLVTIGTNLLCEPIHCLTKFTVWGQIHCISLHGSNLLHCDLFALNIDGPATHHHLLCLRYLLLLLHSPHFAVQAANWPNAMAPWATSV